jgi:hypothetical protein
VTKQTEVVLGEAFAALLPHLDERQRRLALGAAARVLGYGVCAGWPVLGGWRSRRWRAVRAVLGGEPADRVRVVGAGRKRLRERDPGLVPALLALVEPDQGGDPEGPLRWRCRSTRKLAAELTRQGHPVGADTVAALPRGRGVLPGRGPRGPPRAPATRTATPRFGTSTARSRSSPRPASR